MLRKMFILSIACLLFISGCASEQAAKLEKKPISITEKQQPSSEILPMSIKVVGLGDSLTKGVGDELNEGGYVGKLKEKLEQHKDISNVQVENYGVKGYKTSNLLKKLNDEEVLLSLKDADIILMTIGGNDVMNVVRKNIFSLNFAPFRKEQKNFENRFRQIFSEIREVNSTAYIVYVGMYNPFKFMLPELTEIDTIIEEWNQASQTILQEDHKSVFVPIADIFANEADEKLLYKDEFHPNNSGYSLIADKIYDVMYSDQFHNELNVRNE